MTVQSPRTLRIMQTRRFLVTGGSQGIGAAIVNARATPGMMSCSPAVTPSALRLSTATGAHGLAADVADADDNARTVDACRDGWAASTCS